MEAPITPTCRFASGLLLAAVLATPAAAARKDERSIIAEYVRARTADADGHAEKAAEGYATVMAMAPADTVVAVRAYRQALTAGDRKLALKAAQLLDSAGQLPPDGRLLLLSEAIAQGDWKAANSATDRIQREDIFGFLVPIVRAWIAFGGRQPDPMAQLSVRKPNALTLAYASEHRALLDLALGKTADGVAAVLAIDAASSDDSGRSTRLRLAAAAKLAAMRQKDKALALLTGDEDALAVARARVEAGKPLSGAVDTAAAGVAELLIRVAADINRERATPVALALARFATFLAPDNSETWLVTADILSGTGHYPIAIDTLAHIPDGDPFGADARDARVRYLAAQGEQQAALGEALAIANKPGAEVSDWTRVGGLYSDLSRYRESADAYGKALSLAGADKDMAPWSLWLLRGGALEQAGDWPAAREALRKAVVLAPDQAMVLNYLGYAELSRRENLDEAAKLIEKASQLRPDDASITDSLGWSYYLRGDLPKAIATLERAVNSEPGEPTINEHLGDAYWTMGRRLEARYAWRAALVYADGKDADRIRTKLDTGLTPAVAAP
ncbi:tetratricopeptide repeat protein [Flavisphingomonas formosensis]|uniref:tetratricopeptide repeat protein n=1 Tax=Flavisphingomonas formosensis TaxID=861534 RepID=UPI0012F80379|nr:tetratricopeptide repeat protein [Sphingomonas formosensis]